MHLFAREFKIWAGLNHCNVLPCLGFAEYDKSPALILEWMENGSVIEFITTNINMDWLEMAHIFALFVMKVALIFQPRQGG